MPSSISDRSSSPSSPHVSVALPSHSSADAEVSVPSRVRQSGEVSPIHSPGSGSAVRRGLLGQYVTEVDAADGTKVIMQATIKDEDKRSHAEKLRDMAAYRATFKHLGAPDTKAGIDLANQLEAFAALCANGGKGTTSLKERDAKNVLIRLEEAKKTVEEVKPEYSKMIEAIAGDEWDSPDESAESNTTKAPPTLTQSVRSKMYNDAALSFKTLQDRIEPAETELAGMNEDWETFFGGKVHEVWGYDPAVDRNRMMTVRQIHIQKTDDHDMVALYERIGDRGVLFLERQNYYSVTLANHATEIHVSDVDGHHTEEECEGIKNFLATGIYPDNESYQPDFDLFEGDVNSEAEFPSLFGSSREATPVVSRAAESAVTVTEIEVTDDSSSDSSDESSQHAVTDDDGDSTMTDAEEADNESDTSDSSDSSTSTVTR